MRRSLYYAGVPESVDQTHHSTIYTSKMWPFTDNYPEVPLNKTNDWYDYIVVGEFSLPIFCVRTGSS